jgi:LuxR family maltose regulon positive regulatory protein
MARRIGRPYLEFHGLTHGAHAMLLFQPDVSPAEWSRQAVELAERHGWAEEPLAGMAYAQLGIVLLYQGRLDEAEPWLERAERTLRTEVEPAAGMSLRYARAVLELTRGRYADALASFAAAETLAETLVTPHAPVMWLRSWLLQKLVRLGQTERAEQALAELSEDKRATAEMRTVVAALRQWSPRETVPPNITEQLTDSETRVLRYLPTHLTMHDIANELFLSVNTVNTHRRHVYEKLGVHSRHDAVDRARALGLLAPSGRSA